MKKVIVLITVFSISLFYFVKALSHNTSNGLPEDIHDYRQWTKLNKKIIKPRSGDPHRGYKKVFVNRAKNELISSGMNLLFPYPEGTVIVKEVRQTAKKNSPIVLVAIMRKQSGNESTGGWDFVEYTMSSTDSSFIPISFSKEGCYGCHQGASDSDAVWTKFDNF